MASPNKIDITFVVGGEEVTVEANLQAPLLAAVEKALEKSGNTGRKPDEWRVYKDGAPLDLHSKVKDLDVSDGETLELSLKTGAGG